ncbi:MAG: LysM peptidoglycan-binding domain-containing protein [Thermoflexales bacterium]|nr:LysM peptidoglycan-binding domain-containing protein [Thermoflexales bacterium]
MTEKKGGLLGGLVDAVTTRDEKAAVEAAKKEAADALAKLNQEIAKRQEAEARANKAEADLRAAQASAGQASSGQASQVRALEDRVRVADAKVASLEAEVARLKQGLEAAKVRTYVVKSGDSLSKIAQQFYGDAKRWPEIFEANKDKIKDPNLINVGQELRIP